MSDIVVIPLIKEEDPKSKNEVDFSLGNGIEFISLFSEKNSFSTSFCEDEFEDEIEA